MVQIFLYVVSGFEMEVDVVKLMLVDGQMICVECVIGVDGKNLWVCQQVGIQVEVKFYCQFGVVVNFQVECWYQDIVW